MSWMELVIVVLLVATLLVLGVVLRALRSARPVAAPLVDPAAGHGPAVDGRALADLEARVAAVDEREEQLRRHEAEASERATSLDNRRDEIDRAERELQASRADHDTTVRAERDELRAMQSKLLARDEALTRRADRLDELQTTLEQRRAELDAAEARVSAEQSDLATREGALSTELERVAGLDAHQARDEVLGRAEHEARLDAARVVRDVERRAHQDAERTARRIITTAIQRLAAETTSDTAVSAVHLPSEEMKGRIIGREGRNIRTFEQITGVNVLVDDTPETVLISCFDPVRRETARVTLEALVQDGRIHPSRIEEVHERSARQVAERCLRAAEDAVAEVGITDLSHDLLPTIGSLQYRTSFGQNVLRHSLECAHLAGMMASELGLEPATSRRAAFLHDIGKALTHEVEGPHALIGADLIRRHGEADDVVHAVAAHHNEIEPETVEALLVQAADAISGARPGARRESLEAHVRRLARLEEIALEQPGVDRAFAMQAGRELRIMVLPEVVDDLASRALAREVAKAVEDELTYPGEIRVTVVRESRATEVAH